MKKLHIIRIILFVFLTVLIMTAIFLLSSQTGDDSETLSDGFLALVKTLISHLPPLTGDGVSADVRKYAHLFEYFLLGLSASLMFAEFLWKSARRYSASALFSYIFCFIYAASDEFHQSFIPERSAQFSDVLTDSVGFTAGIMCILAVSLIFMKNEGKNK